MMFFDPYQVLNSYHKNKNYKEYFLFFAVAVAGKNAKSMTPKVNQFIGSVIPDNSYSLFDTIKNKYLLSNKMNLVEEKLKFYKN